MSVGADNKQDALAHLQWLRAEITNVISDLERVRVWLIQVSELLEDKK